MAVDIEEELLAEGSDLSRRAARYIRIKRGTIAGLEQQLRRCQEIMECNDPGNARDLFGPSQETPAVPPEMAKAVFRECDCDQIGQMFCRYSTDGKRCDCLCHRLNRRAE